MARRVLAFDWSATPLGAIDDWPRSLRAIVGTCLHSGFPMAVYWGPELTCVYNDAERDVLGDLHPGALGCPARTLLRDSWDVLEPQLRAVMERGETTSVIDDPLRFDRHGVVHTGYFTYSYSPIADDDGTVGGVLLVTEDTTARVLAERRIDALRQVASRAMDAETDREACAQAARALDGHPDVPFLLAYLLAEDGRRATRAASAGLSLALEAPEVVELGPNAEGAGAVFRAVADDHSTGDVVAADLFMTDAMAQKRAFVARIARGTTDPAAGFLVAGVSDDLAFDDAYHWFLALIAVSVGRSVAAARAREAERLRTVAERRRIERDLHDGAQQRLMAIRLELGVLAERLDEPGEVALHDELDRLRGELEAALDELRELAHGLYPPLLASDGLYTALSAAARRSRAPVHIDGDGVGRLPPAVESAAYFCCIEALQNVAKHAGAGARASVRLQVANGALEFRVSDDGAGFDRGAVTDGQGLLNLRERLGALGGDAEITSAPGRGTTVLGQVPLP
jgi:signal transduction histidine kinase